MRTSFIVANNLNAMEAKIRKFHSEHATYHLRNEATGSVDSCIVCANLTHAVSSETHFYTFAITHKCNFIPAA